MTGEAPLPSIHAPAPPAASRVLDDLPGRARVLTEFDLGDWILWSARDTSPSLDGRYETYEPACIGRTTNILNVPGQWQQFVADSNAQAASLHVGTPLAHELRAHWGGPWPGPTAG